ncbi:MAG: TadE family protein [Micropepsaceae bacterium]
MSRLILKRLAADTRGLTVIEFALISPTLLVLMMGTFDLGFRTYATSVLQGEVQKAARDATLETGSSAGTALNTRVQDQVSRIISNGTWTFTRRSYASFTRAGQAENFTDSNGNGSRDAGECYQDENGNSNWDADVGLTGQGTSDDIVMYTASVTYPRLFPMYGLLGWTQNETIAASTTLRNQPYGTQVTYTVTARCT